MSTTEYGVRWHGQDVVSTDGMGNPYSKEDVLERQERYQNAIAVERIVSDWQPVKSGTGEYQL